MGPSGGVFWGAVVGVHIGSALPPTPMTPNPINLYDLGPSNASKPYKFIWFGDIHDPNSYKFIGFGAIHVPKPYKFIRFGAIHDPKPYEFIRFGLQAQGPVCVLPEWVRIVAEPSSKSPLLALRP
jgi:hypothetical protein